MDLYQSLYGFIAEARNYSMVFWLLLPVYSGSLKRIDYPKQICLAHPLSFDFVFTALEGTHFYIFICQTMYNISQKGKKTYMYDTAK